MFDDLTVCTPLPRYLPFPKFLLDAQLSHTAKLLYALLLDRATLSRKNNWTDEQGRIYVVYPIPKLAQTLGCSFSSITRSLTELTNAGLIKRTRSGFSKPSRIFLKIPHTAQKCATTLRISGSSDCAEMTNMIVQKCPPNYLNKNQLSFNHSTEQRNVPLYECSVSKRYRWQKRARTASCKNLKISVRAAPQRWCSKRLKQHLPTEPSS